MAVLGPTVGSCWRVFKEPLFKMWRILSLCCFWRRGLTTNCHLPSVSFKREVSVGAAHTVTFADDTAVRIINNVILFSLLKQFSFYMHLDISKMRPGIQDYIYHEIHSKYRI